MKSETNNGVEMMRLQKKNTSPCHHATNSWKEIWLPEDPEDSDLLQLPLTPPSKMERAADSESRARGDMGGKEQVTNGTETIEQETRK